MNCWRQITDSFKRNRYYHISCTGCGNLIFYDAGSWRAIMKITKSLRNSDLLFWLIQFDVLKPRDIFNIRFITMGWKYVSLGQWMNISFVFSTARFLFLPCAKKLWNNLRRPTWWNMYTCIQHTRNLCKFWLLNKYFSLKIP